MALIPWRPTGPVRQFSERPILSLWSDMDRMFDEVSRAFDLTQTPNGERQATFIPRMDVRDLDKSYEVAVELPGMDEKDIDISYADGVLTLKGEKKFEHEEKKGSFHRIERSYGTFERSIQLPVEVETGRIEATFKKGVLTIQLPKSEKVESRTKIKVKAE